ncbi:unnamed protein product [Onchocerca flexuosa]|uniref:BZIP domain-containing protein n=1 Tax=Onchocerca flexuosa TaxID=387005 RepID=A0A183HSW7_9BILA|nr:unnamed protein product [Onchocerca flexuosa]
MNNHSKETDDNDSETAEKTLVRKRKRNLLDDEERALALLRSS